MKITVTRPFLPPKEEYVKEIESIWESHWLTNAGPKHEMLEKKLAEYLDIPFVSLFANGHIALESAIAVFGFPKGSEVITTPFTFVSTVNAIVRNGLVPVFCDIKECDYTIDPSKIEKLITDKTVAILPVHVYGHVCDVEAIEDIARKHHLKVIYDSAHAFGVSYKGKGIANYGDLNMFSFHATKVFNTVEGGAVSYKDKNLQDKFYSMRNFGLVNGFECENFDGNGKMSEFHAAMGLCNLRYIDNCVIDREKVYKKYVELLEGVNGIKLPSYSSNEIYNHAYLPVVFNGYKRSRDEVLKILSDHGIQTREYFYPLVNEYICYKNKYRGDTPIAKRISEQVLSLPLYSDLKLSDVEEICQLILKI